MLDPDALQDIAAEIRKLENVISEKFGFEVSLSITKAGLKREQRLKPFFEKQYIKWVKEMVCRDCSISPLQLTSPSRNGGLPKYRYMCYQLIKDEFPTIALGRIGQNFGGRDHSTVVHGLREFAEIIQKDENFQNIYQSIKKKLHDKRHQPGNDTTGN
jgi:chromosomal replication initiator protein